MSRAKRHPVSGSGILAAPLATVPAAALHLLGWHGSVDAITGALYMAPVLLPLAYSITLLAGIPYLHALRALGLPTRVGVMAGALVAGVGAGSVVGLVLFPPWDWYARGFYISLGAACGLGTAICYLMLAKMP